MRTFNKNRILFFDVETNGLLPSRSDNFMPEVGQLHAYPHILQVSFIVFNLLTKSVESHADYYIRPPEGVIIPSIVTELTGITLDICVEKGISIGEALEHFHFAYQNCDTIISHNVSFDSAMMRIEQLRNNQYFIGQCPAVLQMFNPIYDDLLGVDHFCTMKASMDLCNILTPRKNGTGTYKKWPTLTELYTHLFGLKPENMHNSIVDALVGLRCYLKIRHNIDMSNNEFDALMANYV
jgi:DNA polymerase-3 subunit alpha